MTRRELLALMASAPVKGLSDAPSAPVAIARCRSYDEDLAALLATMFDQLGGLSGIVHGKTVTVKLNLTGSPALRFRGLPLGVTHYSHPRMVHAFAHLAGQAGARVRFCRKCVGHRWSARGISARFRLERADIIELPRVLSLRTPTPSETRSDTRLSKCRGPRSIPPTTSTIPTRTPTSS
jgi:hypothetical protein